MNVAAEYQSKVRTAEQAARMVHSGDWVDYGFGVTMPIELDKALAARKEELADIKIRGMLLMRVPEVVKADPNRETFYYNSWHFSGIDRQLYKQGLCDFIPMVYRNKPLFYRNYLNVNVAMIQVPPMDQHGYFNFSLTNSATKAILDTADTVILEINKNLPRALGGFEECIHISEVDYIVEGQNPVIPTLPRAKSKEVDQKIAQFVVEEMANGSTIQLGIGALPSAVGELIAQSDLKDLGCHTEMLVDAYLDMYNAGKLNNSKKTVNPGKSAWSFALGSQELYDWLNDNPFLASFPVNYVNDPRVISQQKNMVAINNAVEVDLFGQISSESSGINHISGTGGQLDYVDGASAAEGGKAFICLTSTYQDQHGEMHSRIVPTLHEGEIVTVPRSQSHYIVTEYGKVNLAGRSTWERTELLISIAHPDFRESLIGEAEKMKIWRRSNKRV
ncbi:acetyl-CoA hydrolase/transferase family protein [Neobacillus muris]|uniref:acetyl-CoA hydrolase/transferase family protein n=1 Tax=Neobacillus muris TaxID=2941334 RepID=UPI00203F6770|nr:acetyl-CoA hydrolase/transferase C-terminal domain-containing protein [Neobacillus muris]